MEQKKLAPHWWALLIRGIIAIIFAILAIFATGFTLKLLLIFLSIYLILNGLFALVGSVMAAAHHKNWWILLIEGIISIIVGIIVIAWPGITLAVLIYLVAIWAIITGLIEFLASLVATWAADGKIIIGITGVLSVILGVIIFSYPVFSIAAVIWLIGIYALIIGIALIFFSFKLKAK